MSTGKSTCTCVLIVGMCRCICLHVHVCVGVCTCVPFVVCLLSIPLPLTCPHPLVPVSPFLPPSRCGFEAWWSLGWLHGSPPPSLFISCFHVACCMHIRSNIRILSLSLPSSLPLSNRAHLDVHAIHQLPSGDGSPPQPHLCLLTMKEALVSSNDLSLSANHSHSILPLSFPLPLSSPPSSLSSFSSCPTSFLPHLLSLSNSSLAASP